MNPASIALMKKCGFVEVGLRKAAWARTASCVTRGCSGWCCDLKSQFATLKDTVSTYLWSEEKNGVVAFCDNL